MTGVRARTLTMLRALGIEPDPKQSRNNVVTGRSTV